MIIPPSDNNRDRWVAFLETVHRTLGMYVDGRMLLGVSALTWGFGLGIGDDTARRFQFWLGDRHPEYPNLYAPGLIVHELANDHDTALTPMTIDEQQDEAAALLFLELMIEFVKQRND